MVNIIRREVIEKLINDGMNIILIYIMIARKVIYNPFYKEKVSVSNEDVPRAFKDNIYLIHVYRNGNNIYLDHCYNYEQMSISYLCNKIMEKLSRYHWECQP